MPPVEAQPCCSSLPGQDLQSGRLNPIQSKPWHWIAMRRRAASFGAALWGRVRSRDKGRSTTKCNIRASLCQRRKSTKRPRRITKSPGDCRDNRNTVQMFFRYWADSGGCGSAARMLPPPILATSGEQTTFFPPSTGAFQENGAYHASPLMNGGSQFTKYWRHWRDSMFSRHSRPKCATIYNQSRSPGATATFSARTAWANQFSQS